MKKLKKKLLNARGFRVLLSYVIAAYIRLVLATSKKEYILPESAKPYVESGQQAIIAFWHGRLLLMPHLRPRQRAMSVLISLHRDGLIISETMRRFSIATVAGSSTKGSLRALKNIFLLLKDGGNIAITPDGPKGPFQTAAAGVAHIAAKCQVPVLPATFSSVNYKRASSWDKFFIALPFTTIYFVIGAPVTAQGGTVETLRQEIEQSLRDITAHADRLAGVTA